MAKGKRVSNKSGGDPGKRSSKTGERHYQNVARRLLQDPSRHIKLPKVIRSSKVARIPGPSRRSIVARIAAPIKRFFRSK